MVPGLFEASLQLRSPLCGPLCTVRKCRSEITVFNVSAKTKDIRNKFPANDCILEMLILQTKREKNDQQTENFMIIKKQACIVIQSNAFCGLS